MAIATVEATSHRAALRTALPQIAESLQQMLGQKLVRQLLKIPDPAHKLKTVPLVPDARVGAAASDVDSGERPAFPRRGELDRGRLVITQAQPPRADRAREHRVGAGVQDRLGENGFD